MRGAVSWIAILLGAIAVNVDGETVQGLAPEFSHLAAAEWINSPPKTMATLRGAPVLVEFWTFGCINCRRTLPWMKVIHERYSPNGLQIVSVHTPEFPQEKDLANVRAAVKRLGIGYPVMLDNDSSYWRAMGNQYWPAFYLIDRRGRIVATQIGELHEGQPRADDFEREIKQTLVRP